jgi:hypothetical protein
MGLTVYYKYKIKADAARARALVEELHAQASRMKFDIVTHVAEQNPPEGTSAYEEPSEAHQMMLPGTLYLTRKRADGKTENVSVPPMHMVWFVAVVHGADPATFGLASHPPVVVHREDVIEVEKDGIETTRIEAGDPIEFPTRLRGWYSWQNFCKTQYASDPKLGGADNFLRAHLSLFKMIDKCKSLGMTTNITDDANYWKHRSVERLLAESERWDELIAGFAGRMSDRLGDEIEIAAPIKQRADFEHLEARGQRHLTVKRKRKKRP